MYVQIRNHLRHQGRPIPLNYATLLNLSHNPIALALSISNCPLPSTVIKNVIKSQSFASSIPSLGRSCSPTFSTGPCSPCSDLPRQCSASGPNTLHPKPLANLRPILLPRRHPVHNIDNALFFMSSRKLAKTVNFPIRSWLPSLCSALYASSLPEKRDLHPKPSMFRTRLSHSPRFCVGRSQTASCGVHCFCLTMSTLVS